VRKFIEEFNKKSPYVHLRADIDDREESVSRKIRDAEQEWVPIIVVVGEKESKSKTFIPRFRNKTIGEENHGYSIDELYKLIYEMISVYPQHKIPLSVHLSKRPKFK
jgi:threonyl-tRNA synthetase